MSEFPKAGEIFNQRYELLEILGSGGIGTVFKAMQLESRRTVALKIMRREFAEDEEFKKRFLREARALSQLSHPNIVTVYHIGVSETGLAYIAMEIICGVSLRQLLKKEGALPAMRAVAIMQQLTSALVCVHEQGIVHRDIKPENIILVEKPEPDTVKLIDFGLARLSSEQKLTQTGLLIGSVNYMSPEQCQGVSTDARGDIYSSGLCFFEMLTGKTAFLSDNPVGVIYKQINEAVPAITRHQVDRYTPALNEIIARAAAKSPLGRYQTTRELGNDLSSLKQTLEGVKPSQRAWCLPGNAFLVIAAAICTTLSVLLLVNYRMVSESAKVAEVNKHVILKEDRKSVQNQRQAEKLLLEVKRKEHRYQGARGDTERLGAGDQLASSLHELSQVQIDCQDYKQAEATLRKELDLCEVLDRKSEDKKAKVFKHLASCKMAEHDMASAEDYLKKAFACKLLKPATKSDLCSRRAAVYLYCHRIKEAELDLRYILTSVPAFQDLDRTSKVRLFTEEPFFVTDAYNLYKILANEKLNGDKEMIAALDFMNDVDTVLLDYKSRSSAEALNYTVMLLKKISPAASNYRAIARRAYQLLSRYEAETRQNQAAAAQYKQKADLLGK